MSNRWTRVIVLVVLLTHIYSATASEVRPSFERFKVGDITPEGWIKAQIERDLRQGFAGHFNELTARGRSNQFGPHKIDTFKGTVDSEFAEGAQIWWYAWETSVWWDGRIRMAYLIDSKKHINAAEKFVNEVLEAQKNDDGYIGVYSPRIRYNHPPVKDNGEMATQAVILNALLSYYELTGKQEVLNAVERAAKLTISKYNDEHPYFSINEQGGGVPHGLMFVDIMEWLYRLIKDESYKEFGKWCYSDYCRSEKIREQGYRLVKLLDMNELLWGHAVHITENIRVPLWVYYMTGENVYEKAYKNAYEKIQNYQTISGAIIGDEWIRKRKPLECISHENCGNIELSISFASALEKTGNAHYGDKIERIAFNAIQSARLSNGKAISYQTSDNRYSATIDGGIGGRFKYSPTHEGIASCCPANHTRFITYYTSNMWMQKKSSKDAITATLYGPCTLKTEIDGTEVEINEITDYPFSETVTFDFNVEHPVEFDIFLRVPEWVKEIDVKLINGRDEDLSQEQQDNYCRISKKWKTGDRITVNFETVIKPVKSVSGDVALQRGPLLYALPIESRSYVSKTYDIEGFADLNFVAEEGTECGFNFVRKSPNVSPTQIESCGFVLFRNN